MALPTRSPATCASPTLHANNSYHAMNRIISFYPLENRPSAAADLSAALQADHFAAPGAHQDRQRAVPAVEVLLNTRHIAELIEKGEINEIKDAMEKSMSPGSQTFEQALFHHISTGKVSVDEAMAHSDSPTNLHWLLNNAPKPTSGAASVASPTTSTAKSDDLSSVKLNFDALG